MAALAFYSLTRTPQGERKSVLPPFGGRNRHSIIVDQHGNRIVARAERKEDRTRTPQGALEAAVVLSLNPLWNPV